MIHHAFSTGPQNCYPVLESTLQARRMLFPGPPNLSGLQTALAIEAAGGWHDYETNHLAPAPLEEAQAAFARIARYDTPEKMPAEAQLLQYLVDATASLHGETNRAAGWRILGLQPSMGRKFISRDRAEPALIHWPLWYTALSFGLGYASFSDASAYDDITPIEARLR